MIVEIRDIDCEELCGFLIGIGFAEITEREELDKKIIVGLNRGIEPGVRLVNTHRSVWGKCGLRIFLQEPEKSCATFEGPVELIALVLGGLHFDPKFNFSFSSLYRALAGEKSL